MSSNAGRSRIERRADQLVEREVLPLLQHTHRVNAARVLRTRRHVRRDTRSRARARRARRRERRAVRVLDPPGLRIEQRDGLADQVQALPFGGRIAAVHRLRPIEARIAPRREVAVPVGDVAIGVGVDGVVRRVRAQVHHLVERRVRRRLRAPVRLRQRLERLVHQLDGDPLAIGLPHDRSVMTVVHGDHLLAIVRRPPCTAA